MPPCLKFAGVLSTDEIDGGPSGMKKSTSTSQFGKHKNI